MTVVNWLKQARKYLEAADLGTARLDALVLLEDVTGWNRAWLLAHPEAELSAAQAAELEKLLKRRAGHQPLAYIRGKTEFYGREYVLTPAVLQPRPESETMIDLLKALPVFNQPATASTAKAPKNHTQVRIADVGAGSGALGITAYLELPNVEVKLLEIDPKALKVAKINVDKFTLNIKVLETDLLAQSHQDYDILLCNLPYVPDGYQINQAAMQEPKIAIFGGPDGLDLYRKLFRQIDKLKKQPLYILTEALPPQHAVLEQIAGAAGYKLQLRDDFIQVFERTQKTVPGSR